MLSNAQETGTIHHGDCVEVMGALPEDSVDAVVCDPPYGLEFMGKKWDRLDNKGVGLTGAEFTTDGMGKGFRALPAYSGNTNPLCRNCKGSKRGRDRKGFRACRCESPDFPNVGAIQGTRINAWHLQWLTEARRVLRPDAPLLAFSGTRTFHRLAAAMEDAGFSGVGIGAAWTYGSGFPKSLNVGKAIDKAAGAERTVVTGTRHRNAKPYDDAQGWNANNTTGDHAYTAPATVEAATWEGYGTALKPAWEPVVSPDAPTGGYRVVHVLRKPLSEGTVASNCAKWGTAAINIDGCRVATHSEGPGTTPVSSVEGQRHSMAGDMDRVPYDGSKGRWPANLILLHLDGCRRKETVANWVCGPGCPVAALDVSAASFAPQTGKGGPSRFFLTPGARDSAGLAYFVRLLSPPTDDADVRILGTPEVAALPPHSDATPGPHGMIVRQPDAGTAWVDAALAALRPGGHMLLVAPSSQPSGHTGACAAEDAGFEVRDSLLVVTDASFPAYYVPKAAVSEREAGLWAKDEVRPKSGTGSRRNTHPTVKPIKVMAALLQQALPGGGHALDPFAGSGTTLCAAPEGVEVVGIEREAEYVATARARIAHWRPAEKPPLKPSNDTPKESTYVPHDLRSS